MDNTGIYKIIKPFQQKLENYFIILLTMILIVFTPQAWADITINEGETYTSDTPIEGNVYNYGTFINNSTITGAVTNYAGGNFTSNGQITGEVTNSGMFDNNAYIDGVIYNRGTLYSNASYFGNSVEQKGTLYLEGGSTIARITGTLNQTTIGSPVIVTADTTVFNLLYPNRLTINEGVTLTTTATIANLTSLVNKGVLNNQGRYITYRSTYELGAITGNGLLELGYTSNDFSIVYLNKPVTQSFITLNLNSKLTFNADLLTLTSNNGLRNAGTANITGGGVNFNINNYSGTNGIVNITGDVATHKNISNNTININSGSFSVLARTGESVSFGNKLTSAEGTVLNINGTVDDVAYTGDVTLDMRNDATDANTVANLVLNTDLGYALDVMADGTGADTLAVTSLTSNGHNIDINGVSAVGANLALAGKSVAITGADSTLAGAITMSDPLTLSQDNMVYRVTKSVTADTAYLNFELGSLYTAFKDATTTRAYTMTASETMPTDIGAMGGTTLTVSNDGHGYAIDGDGHSGLRIAHGQTLTVNNPTSSAKPIFQNFANTTSGGAIYNEGTIGTLHADFTDNSITTETNGFVGGSAILNYTNATVTTISGDFVGNYTINTSTETRCKAFGAISNYNATAGAVTKMGDITGSFVGNYVESGYTGYGGAIGNYSSNATAKIEIDNIAANFSGNYVKATNIAYGGAIANIRVVSGATITMGDITGDFISNYVESTNNSAYGGAIGNGVGSTINSISGDFMYNTATSTSGTAYGGAIYNTGTINSITGTFSNNTTGSRGGAIYNSGTMTITNSLFENNSAGNQGGAIRVGGGNLTIIDTDFLNNKSTGAGGAICNTGTLYIQASLKNVTFSGNTGEAGADIHSNYGNVRLNSSLDKSINFGSNVNIYNDSSEVDKGILDINNSLYGDTSGTVNFNSTLFVRNILNICGGTVNFAKSVSVTNETNIAGGVANFASSANIGKVSITGGTTNFAKNVSVTNATDITGGTVNVYGNLTSPKISNESDLNVYSANGVTIKGALTSGVGSNLVVNGSNGVTDYSGKVLLNTRNVGIEANTLGNLTLNTDLNYTFDMNLADKVADTLDMSGTLIANSHNVVVDRINVLEGNIRRSSTVNLTDSPDLARIFTPNGGDWKAIVKYSDGSDYTGKNVAFNPATGDLRFVNFDLSTGTIDKMTAKSETYLDSNHDIIALSDTQGANTHSVYIDGTPYYFTTTDENLNALVTTGNCAIKETVATDSTAVFTYGGKYYTYDYDKLPISNYETSVVENPESGADYHYSETDNEGNTTYYNIDIPVERLGKSDRVKWDEATPDEAIADAETGQLNSGYVKIVMKKADGSDDIHYFKYTYIGRRNNDASLGASLKARDEVSLDENGTKSTSDGKETASQTYKRVMQEQRMEFVRAAAYGSKTNPKPCVLSAPIAAQVGGYLTQVNSYDQAFANLDMEMLNSASERAVSDGFTDDINNKSHAKQSNSGSLSALLPYCLSAFSKDSKGLWTRPYATFERVHLTSGPTVGNIAYGNFFGGDMGKKSLRNGWKRQFSAYIGYNGSTQDFDRQSIDQNGGTLGVMETWYKGNFFTALTANVSGNFADANTDIGKERMAMIMAGVASKTGYNFEFIRGKFIIQPSILLSYSFVHTFAHNNGLGSRVHSSPLNAIQVAPGIKFIANLKNGWQPYLGVNMRWNIIDKTSFNIREVNIPDMSIHPYVEYGIGLQKRWGDRFTGYFQTMLRNGARNGVMLSLGLRWAIGK